MTIKVLAAFYMTTIGVASEGDIIEVPQATGEMLISVGLAEEFSGGGGGGGFTTAQVTIVNTTQDALTMMLPCFEENILGASFTVFENDTVTKSVPVLTSEGTAGSDLDEHEASAVTGDVELGPYGTFIVHGDGSVTF